MERRKQAKSNDQDSKSGWVWQKEGTIVYGDGGTKGSEKIASFDMDFTLIKTKSGGTFPKNADDWVIWDESVLKKLRDLSKDGFKLVIFSNQNGLSKGKITQNELSRKIENISALVGVPFQVFLSSEDDSNKKPCRGMWDLFEKKKNDGIKVDLKQSFYCGDAAGRKGPPKDFSDSDLKFALVVGVQFYVPEQLFLGQKEEIQNGKLQLKEMAKNPIFKEKNAEIISEKQEIVVFCGSPGSGKSTFCTEKMNKYSRVNRDTLKTKEKCVKVAEEEIKKGKSVVIDNTNPSQADRKLYLDIAKKHGIQARCFYFDIPKEISFHLNEQRAINQARKHLSDKISKIPIHTWYKNHEKPTQQEGFDQVLHVNFVPGPFQNPEDERIFYG